MDTKINKSCDVISLLGVLLNQTAVTNTTGADLLRRRIMSAHIQLSEGVNNL